jgi:hypothetical protein
MVSPRTRAVVWARSAGRCQYPGCNEHLIGELISGKDDANFGLIAHIVADTENGPRGDSVRSPQLADDPANLMLLCYKHHKLIDVEGKDDHPEQRLLDMKAAHESRIRIVTGITPDLASHVLRSGAKIGVHESPVSFNRVSLAMLPDRYPADGTSIGIEILGSAAQDGEAQFWATEPNNLRRQFEAQVRSRIAQREVTHLSVFALGPIPLLFELGRLLCDIVPADVYQLHREPAGWRWAKDGPRIRYEYSKPSSVKKNVALKIALSATITDDRIASILGDDVSIWSVTAAGPNNDIMRYPGDLREFRRLLRSVYNDIRAAHGPKAVINVFPAVPVSAAVEAGRVWMPKADLPLEIFDENRGSGFVHRLRIG